MREKMRRDAFMTNPDKPHYEKCAGNVPEWQNQRRAFVLIATFILLHLAGVSNAEVG